MKKLPWTILEEQFPVPRYTAASKIGNSVISLLWQLRCRCNPDHNKFSSFSNTTVVAIFPNLCLWRRTLCSNLGGIDPEKLYQATLKMPKLAQIFEESSGKRQVCVSVFFSCFFFLSVAVGLFSNRSQRTSKCGKNINDTIARGSCATSLFLPHFDVICDLLLNRRTATWNLFVK